jgi:hypothetical protein
MEKLAQKHILVGLACVIGAISVVSLTNYLLSVELDTKYKIAALRGDIHQLPHRKPPFMFPDGGRQLAGKYRMVALYGAIDSPALGILGEQPVGPGIARAKQLASEYQPFSHETMYPAFEIIATVAAAEPTNDGNYSREADPNAIRPWIDVAKANGVYVVLDLQPGRTDFLSQARMYESLLTEPNVGLALDPEWRLAPNQFHLQQIGSVAVDEVDATSQWLADLTKQHHLPQKLFLLHQFRVDMIAGREHLQLHPELSTIVQMDGQGAQNVKNDTWNATVTAPPPGIQFGWKNFLDEDKPMLSPEATMQHIPKPWYVSYQ